MARTRSERRHFRHVKGLRRLIEDRNQHYQESSCPCLADDARKGHGKIFARMADYPQVCSCLGCGNPRRHSLKTLERLTMQERRAPDVTDFDIDSNG